MQIKIKKFTYLMKIGTLLGRYLMEFILKYQHKDKVAVFNRYFFLIS